MSYSTGMKRLRDINESIELLLEDSKGSSESFKKFLLFQSGYPFSTDSLLPEIIQKIVRIGYNLCEEVTTYEIYGGTPLHWYAAIGLQNEQNIRQFLDSLPILKFKFPQREYRENGILKELWKILPEYLDSNRMDFYGEIEEELRDKIWSFPLAKASRNDAKLRNEVDNVVKDVLPYYYACASEDSIGSPYRIVGLPEAQVQFTKAWNHCKKKYNSIDDAINYLCELSLPRCIGRCGYMDTSSRECLYYG